MQSIAIMHAHPLFNDPILFQAIFNQLDLRSQLNCSYVNRDWSLVSTSLLARNQLFYQDKLENIQLDVVRHVQLTRASAPILSHLHELRNLQSLVISSDVRLCTNYGDRACLARLLPTLSSSLRSLSIRGQDLRLKPLKAIHDRPAGTDAALSALAHSRTEQSLPGLQHLEISSSPDLTDTGLIEYLSCTLSSDCSLPSSYTQTHPGFALLSISLVNCPLLTAKSLYAISKYCPNLQEAIFKSVDALLIPPHDASNGGREQATLPLVAFARNCSSLRSLTLANVSDKATLDLDIFSGFQHHPSLRNLSISSSKQFAYHHLSHFTSLHKLVISGCPSLRTDLPFEHLPELREVSYLGPGLSVGCIGKLWRCCSRIRKLTVDVAGDLSPTSSGTSIDSSGTLYESLDSGLPAALQSYAQTNVLAGSQDLPSWALAYLLSFAPTSLEAVALYGTVEAYYSRHTSIPVEVLNRVDRMGGQGCSYGTWLWGRVGATGLQTVKALWNSRWNALTGAKASSQTPSVVDTACSVSASAASAIKSAGGSNSPHQHNTVRNLSMFGSARERRQSSMALPLSLSRSDTAYHIPRTAGVLEQGMSVDQEEMNCEDVPSSCASFSHTSASAASIPISDDGSPATAECTRLADLLALPSPEQLARHSNDDKGLHDGCAYAQARLSQEQIGWIRKTVGKGGLCRVDV